jgi:hypothetical protein
MNTTIAQQIANEGGVEAQKPAALPDLRQR